jgi:tRNA-dihydrouridine synthase C
VISVKRGIPALILAPMEGVTDAPMRACLTERGGFDFCVTEFYRISQDVPASRAFLRHMPELAFGARTPAGVPVQLQLLGGNPERMALAAERAVAAGAIAIDLNFGCPAPTVNRNDGGATLLKHPERLEAIVRAVREAVPRALPVSAKLRLGWDNPRDIFVNAERAVRGGASWITIHGRTKVQGYAPPALWAPIGEVQRALNGSSHGRDGIAVVANGDIRTLEDFLRCREETGCEHFMIGRSALANPSLVPAIRRELGMASAQKLSFPDQSAATVDWSQAANWLPVLRRFHALCESTADNENYMLCRTKKWLGYVSSFNASARGATWIQELRRTPDAKSFWQGFARAAEEKRVTGNG